MALALPPLNALRSFEAAARFGSYVNAGRELSVTAAAISQQVLHLEAFLGRKLFTRLNNRIVLTDAGAAVYAETEAALGLLSGMAARLSLGAVQSRLVVSILPSMAEAWFLPKLAGWQKMADVPKLDIRVENDPVAFARDDIDLRLCYGTHLYPDMLTIPIFSDEVLPLCAPELVPEGGLDFRAVPDALLVHTNWGASFASLPGWAEWFAKHAAGRRIDVSKGHLVGTSLMAIEMARNGIGIALCQRHLVGDLVARGALVVAHAASMALGHPYAAVLPYSKARRAPLQGVLNLLGCSVPTQPKSAPERPNGDLP